MVDAIIAHTPGTSVAERYALVRTRDEVIEQV